METINERLARFVEHVGGTQPNGKGIPEVARKSGLDPNTLRVALKENASKPSFDTLSAILNAYPVLNSDWFMLGKGEMLKWGDKALAHARPTDEARATTHPTIQPADKELATGTANGPTMQGIVPGEATPVQVSMVDRLIRNLEEENAKKDALIEWLQQQNAVLLGKSPGNLLAAGPSYPSPVSLTPIGPRFDTERAEAKVLEMWKQAA